MAWWENDKISGRDVVLGKGRAKKKLVLGGARAVSVMCMERRA